LHFLTKELLSFGSTLYSVDRLGLGKLDGLAFVEERTIAFIFLPLAAEHADKCFFLVKRWLVFEYGQVLVLVQSHLRSLNFVITVVRQVLSKLAVFFKKVHNPILMQLKLINPHVIEFLRLLLLRKLFIRSYRPTFRQSSLHAVNLQR